jgi:methylated-DNA-protein-cysteine methyltransferase related protein
VLRRAWQRGVEHRSNVPANVGFGSANSRLERKEHAMKKIREGATDEEQIWQVVRSIPRGCVATYGQVAVLAGLPGGARKVGRTMSRLPNGTRLPWHRVVNASGRISLPLGSTGYREQKRRLEREGVAFVKGRLSLARFRWRP